MQTFRKPVTVESEPAKLFPRKQQILKLLAEGRSYKNITAATGITYDTMHGSIRHIYEKLHVRSRAQAVNKHVDFS